MSYRLVKSREFSEKCPVCGVNSIIKKPSKPEWLKGTNYVKGITSCSNCEVTIIVLKEKKWSTTPKNPQHRSIKWKKTKQ